MEANPYKPPVANVERAEVEPDVPQEILKKIKTAWIAGIVSIVLTTIFILIAIGGMPIMGINAWGFLDVALMVGLTLGVYKNSRVCAVAMLAFFVLNKIIMWKTSGTVSGWWMALLFAWAYYQGVVGTFQYHSWKRENAAA